MPNRILRDGILTSARVNSLRENAELFYRRLMSVVDDFGRYDARANLLRVVCYPLKVDSVREADISRLLAEVQQAGLLALYEVDGRSYLQMMDFRQQIRATTSKYPPPPEDETHLHSTCVADDKQLHTKAEAKSETYPKSEAEGGPTAPFMEIMPKKLRDSPAFIIAWCLWVKDAADRGKPINANSARTQFGDMEAWTMEEAVLGLRNAVSGRKSMPFRPDPPKNKRKVIVAI